MNYRGSYRHLLRNAKAAMLAGIEIYNKPRFTYRDECTVILLLNAWELVLKALVSKNKKSIFYAKKKGEPYRTLSWRDALARAEQFFPKEIHSLPIRRNLEFLSIYRDNSIHFYNKSGFSSVIYALAQTSIVNFKDLVAEAFAVDFGEEISWQLLPLGLKVPIDPIKYLSEKGSGNGSESQAVRQFLTELAVAADEVEKAGQDTGRLLTIFTVKLESTKKIEKADIVVGVEKAGAVQGPLAIVKTVDPNISHPLRQKDVVEKVGTLHGKKFTPYTCQAIVRKYAIKEKPQYYWQVSEKVITKYSNDFVTWIRTLSASDVETAVEEYRAFLITQRAKKQKANQPPGADVEVAPNA